MIGPSHIDTHMINSQKSKLVFDESVELDGRYAIANWSKYILEKIEEKTCQNKKVVWMVSNWLLNNYDFNDLKRLPENELWLHGIRGTREKNGICKKLMTTDHITFLAGHTVKIIDFIVHKYPTIKLIFWCLYQRTVNTISRSTPFEFTYYSIIEKYKHNIIDIDFFLKKHQTTFKEVIIDEAGHPNKIGYIILNDMLTYNSTY